MNRTEARIWLPAAATILVGSIASPTAAEMTSFVASQYFAVGTYPAAVAAGDFNGDGVEDIVTVNAGSSDVSLLLSNANGTFEDARSFATGGNPRAMAVGDFDGDDRMDVALLDDRGVSLLPGNGDGTFQPGVLTPAAGISLVAGGFDRDGRLDLALGTTAGVSVLPGNGDGTFQPAQSATGGGLGFGPRFVAAGDFNRDGVLDLATADMDSHNVSVYLRNGDGTFRPTATFSVIGSPGPSTLPWALVAGDFNGDGTPDLATANLGAAAERHGSVSLLLGSGNGTFQTARNRAAAGRPVALAARDLNDDGVQDLMVTSADTDNFPRPCSYASAWLGQRSGIFTTQSMMIIESAGAVAWGDFDGDGLHDVATANFASVSVALGRGGGIFRTAPAYALSRRPRSVAVGDFNGDGRPDVAATDTDRGIAVLMGNGGAGGTLRPAVYFDASARAWSVIVTHDFNGDGAPDLAVAGSSPDEVAVYLGDGFTFQAPLASPVGADPQSLAASDLNGDGRPDLAVANTGSNTVSVLLGNGDGTFLAGTNLGVGSQPRSVAAGDFNGDGRPDLAVANTGSDTVSVLLGNGDGTFPAVVDFGVGDQPRSLAVGDFNGDEKADLAVVNGGSGDVSALAGNGDGTFQPARAFAAGLFPSSVAVEDFNDDGVQDLVVGGGLASVAILPGTGDGSFRAALCFGVGANPASIAVGDFDGDGRPDVVTANLNSNDISMLLYPHGGGPDRAPTPVLDPPGGTFYSPLQVTITGALPWGAIQYTTDGSTPTISSALYTGPIMVAETMTIRAISTAAHFAPSRVASRTYTVLPAPENLPPIARAGDDQTMEASDAVGAVVTLDGSASSDPDGDPLIFTWSWSSGGITGVRPTVQFPLGGTAVTLVAADPQGATGTEVVQITVQDTTPPVLVLPGRLTENATSPNGAVLTYAASASDLHAGAVALVCVPASGDTFPINPRGEVTEVDCAAADGQGNSAQGSFPAHVAGADEQLQDVVTLIDLLHLSKGPASILKGRLQDVLQGIAAGRPEHACRKMAEFARMVRLESRKKRPEISTAQSEGLLLSARRIRAVLGCG